MLKLSPKFLEENGQKKFVVLTMGDYAAIREALEDAEDARILEEAIRRDAGRPRIPFAEVKRQLAAQRRAKAPGRKKGKA
jgi:peptidyl-tRNA hydrolase